MKIEPKIMGNVCFSAHPKGLQKRLLQDVRRAKSALQSVSWTHPPKNALIIGCSAGYGLATRIALAFGMGVRTVGLSYEKEASRDRSASLGWYNNTVFDQLANAEAIPHVTLNGDAFSPEGKAQTIQALQSLLQGEGLDLVIYSLASPKRTVQGQTYQSVIKPIGQAYQGTSLDIWKETLKDVQIEPATPEEIDATVKVMGGEDWLWWMEALSEANLLSPHLKTVAYSYLGPTMTHPIYQNGTIGKAKEDLEQKARTITERLQPLQGQALVSVNKAVATRASSVIPSVPLYLAILWKVMKQQGTHEDCLDQAIRFMHALYGSPSVPLDAKGRIRLDDREMADTVQTAVLQIWSQVRADSLRELTDIDGFRKDFMQLHGFEVEGVDYSEDVDPHQVSPIKLMEQ